MSADPRDERERLALDLLLGNPAEQAEARARLRANGTGEADARLGAGLSAQLADAAEELRSAACPRPREARFVARVLAATTRQDLSWRGDLRLTLEFLRARLRASPALRLVAASLVLHLVAAPAVALWMFRARDPEPRVRIEFELPSESPFAAPTPATDESGDELVRLARLREARENALAQERFLLERVGPSAPRAELAPGAPLALELLEARARGLRVPWSASGVRVDPLPESAGPLARTLWVELALDRFVLRNEKAEGLGPAALGLARIVGDAELARTAPGTLELATRALGRARALGLVEQLGWGPPSTSLPLLDPAWFEALGRAGQEAGLADAEPWSAWMAWERP